LRRNNSLSDKIRQTRNIELKDVQYSKLDIARIINRKEAQQMKNYRINVQN
jgi:hypothetical protein